MLLAWFLYLMWGIPASTYGEFFPYIFSSLHLVSLRDTYAFEAKDRIHFFDAENITELIPGISALWVGCHHRASLAFIINTGKGKSKGFWGFWYNFNGI